MLENTGNPRKINPIVIDGVSSNGADSRQLSDLTVPSEGLVVQYLRLGLHAMALQEARLLNRQGSSVWSVLRLAQAAENAGFHNEARLAAQSLIVNHQEPEGYEFLARQAARNNNWCLAAELLSRFLAVYPDDVQAQARYCWICAIAGKPVTDSGLAAMDVSGEWPALLRSYLIGKPASLVAATDTLIARADRPIEKSEAHFYAAFKYWQSGLYVETARQLRLVRQEGSLGCEYGWASLILRTI